MLLSWWGIWYATEISIELSRLGCIAAVLKWCLLEQYFLYSNIPDFAKLKSSLVCTRNKYKTVWMHWLGLVASKLFWNDAILNNISLFLHSNVPDVAKLKSSLVCTRNKYKTVWMHWLGWVALQLFRNDASLNDMSRSVSRYRMLAGG